MKHQGGDRVFYVHVPSCGGTTLWSVLRSVYGKGQCQRGAGIKSGGRDGDTIPDYGKHFKELPAIGGHLGLSVAHQHFPDRAAVTILRHPVDQAISAYYRYVRNGRWTPDPSAGQSDILRYYSKHAPHVIPKYCGPAFGDVPSNTAEVKAFMQNNFRVIGIAEEFDRSLHLMAQRLNWADMPLYDRRNSGGNRPDALPDEVLAKLAEHLSPDIEVYQHGKELFHQACKEDLPEDIDARLRRYHHQLAWRARLKRLINFGRNPYIKRAK